MTTNLRILSSMSIAAPLLACAPASGDRGPGQSCGPGTTAIGGVCVPSDGSESGGEPGTTTAASTDADASTGAVAASSSGSAGVDTTTDADTTTGAPPLDLDLDDAILHDNPPDLASWPVTTQITRLTFSDAGVHLEFSKQDGDDRWPDIVPPGWDGPLQYTVGLVENIDGVWHASAAIQYWYGLDASGGNVALDDQIALSWYYDGRWGEMAGYQPATGEFIGVFVVAGNVRGVLDGSQSPVHERSNVVVVPMPDTSGASYEF